jgi:hypothetical protein
MFLCPPWGLIKEILHKNWLSSELIHVGKGLTRMRRGTQVICMDFDHVALTFVFAFLIDLNQNYNEAFIAQKPN